MSATDSVTVRTQVAVDPATAFSIFTEEIEAWWKPKARHLFRTDRTGTLRFEPRAGVRLLEIYADAGDEPFEVGRVLVWTPGERLVFEWRQGSFAAGETTQVEVRFEPASRGTRVTLEHRGWDTLRPDHPARQGFGGEALLGMLGLRWADALTTFRAHAARGPKGNS